MIERYSLPEMTKIWSTQNKFQRLLDVEKAVAKAQAELGLIPQSAAQAIETKGRFDVANIAKIEKTTKHDVIAFVTDVAQKVGKDGRFVHFGLTSSDVLDTALSLQITDAFHVLDWRIGLLEKTIRTLIKKYELTPCVGRTHGIHAEPTTLGLKFAGFLAELKRNRKRISVACHGAAFVKISGAVGTYSSMSPEVENLVARELHLPPETIATQVIPRDRHAEIFAALAILGGGFERIAVELRHLQRTEVGEVEESFGDGQKGSSAMPHKKNPISSENITGLSRLLRGYAVSAFENISLWHERDISHSSVERVIFPDAFILADYMTHRLNGVLKGLKVNSKKMAANLQMTHGQVYSSLVLSELVKKGLSRDEAYKLIQRYSHRLKDGEDLEVVLGKDKTVKKLLTKKDLAELFSGVSHRKFLKMIVKRVLQ